MATAFFPGFFLGLSLIIAIGAQNAFVLRQGLRRSYVCSVVLTCALSDAILIAAGTFGFAAFVDTAPWIQPAIKWGGAAFLTVYGAFALRNAFIGGESLRPAEEHEGGRISAILTAIALTWLNPHVYLDTVVILGSVSTEYGEDQVWFALGAIVASFVFFFTLGYGARLVAPLFATPLAWRLLDLVVGLTMWTIAATLIF